MPEHSWAGRAPIRRVAAAALLAAGLLAPAGPDWVAAAEPDGETLQAVQARGLLECGLTSSGFGLSEIDAEGRWIGFFPDLCRALAAAILGDGEAVRFVEVDFDTRFDALKAGAFDVLMSNSTWTSDRDIALGLSFTGTLLYDGQGFLAPRALGVDRLEDLEQATVCVLNNTTTIANLRELVAERFPALTILEHRSEEGGFGAFFTGECDLLTNDRIALVSLAQDWSDTPQNYTLLTDVISREPLNPVVREGDANWFELVQWAMFALIVAEEHGVTSANVDAARDRDNPETRRLLGEDDTAAAALGLPPDWAHRMIRQLGNYGEIYDRHLGAGSPLGLARGLNDLWTRGGLIYAPPFR